MCKVSGQESAVGCQVSALGSVLVCLLLDQGDNLICQVSAQGGAYDVPSVWSRRCHGVCASCLIKQVLLYS